jgi:hypothetical protein
MAFGFAFRCLTNRPHSNSEKPELDLEPKLLVIDTTVACSLSNLPKATPELRTEALRTSPTAPIGRRLGTAPLPKKVHGGSLSRLDSTESGHRGRSPESQVRRVERAPRFASGSEEPSSKPRFRFRRRGRDHVSIRTLAPTEVGVGTRNKAPFELPLPTFANGCPSPTEVDYEHSLLRPAAWSVFDCRSRRRSPCQPGRSQVDSAMVPSTAIGYQPTRTAPLPFELAPSTAPKSATRYDPRQESEAPPVRFVAFRRSQHKWSTNAPGFPPPHSSSALRVSHPLNGLIPPGPCGFVSCHFRP